MLKGQIFQQKEDNILNCKTICSSFSEIMNHFVNIYLIMKRHHNREANQRSKQPTKTQNEVGYSVYDHNPSPLEARGRGFLLKCEDSLGYTSTGLARAIQDLVSKSKAKQNKEMCFWSINVCIFKFIINKEAAILRSWDKSFPLPLPRQMD